MENLLIKRAILSVTDKSGITEFAAFLHENGVEILSTGGTERTLREAGLPVTPVSEVTGFPEILGGRVKTLNPKIHGGILADKDNPEHLETLKKHGIVPIDLVCVNLYNFSSAVARALSPRAAIEEIDIGGPCMLRAAAKNFHSVLVVPGTVHYAVIREELEKNGMRVSLGLRQRMAQVTFTLTSEYDAMIASYMASW